MRNGRLFSELSMDMIEMRDRVPDPGPDRFVTNFDKSQIWLYKRAIARYNDSKDIHPKIELYIHDAGYDCRGKRIDNYLSLRAKSQESLSDFWKIFDAIKRAHS